MTHSEGLPDRSRRLVMACVLLGVTLGNLDAAIANVALPTIGRELAVSDAATVWIVNSYQIAAAVSLLPAVAFAELWSLKRVYGFGLALFGLASLTCALSPDLTILVAARLAQGVAGACLAALGPALVRMIYPRARLAAGLALMALMVAISAAAGPTIAAVILSVARWPWLFLVNLPICAVALPLFLALAPAGETERRPFDAPGALLSGLALGLVVLGVDALGGEGVRVAIGEILAGLGCAALLVWEEGRRRAPLLPLDLIRIPLFAWSMLASSCAYAAQILAYVSLPFLFQNVMGLTPLATGLLMTPWPLLVAVSAPVSGRAMRRLDPPALSSAGLLALLCGLALLASLPRHPASADVVWRMALCGIGFGFFQTPNNTMLMTTGPAGRSAAAGGMMAFARTVGWSFGSALVALLFALAGRFGAQASLAAAALLAGLGAAASSARLFARR